MTIEITTFREPSVGGATLSKLFLGGDFVCDVLEDQIREVPGVPVVKWKVAGQTAIPAGKYRLVLVNSGKFGPDTLSISGVEGFDLIRIHGGNTQLDTLGCLLTGTRNGANTVVKSQDALRKLRTLIVPRMKAGEEAWIRIRNPGEVP